MHTLQQLLSGELKGATRLKLSCSQTEFPDAIFDLAETLEILDLTGNNLSTLPATFSRLKNLKIAFFSDNLFTEFPAVLGQCKKLEMVGFKACKIKSIPENAFPESLRWLILTDNAIEKLPDSIGICTRLQKVALAGNWLRTLPDSMKNCRNIELLRISANSFTKIPDWLFNLPKLSWLAFAGNPCVSAPQLNQTLPEIDWNSMATGEKLGEGASGHIWKATFNESFSADFPPVVAVKVFKGEVTSDGLPADEMNAGILAGAHPNIVSVLGKIANHPEKKQGLVFKLIPSDFSNLGNPPSFKTCTRDTFPDGTVFRLAEILTIISGIASAVAQLHQNGCMHGDLYTHNILINNTADPLLGDFGAATVYDKKLAEAALIERIEVRAFGCLLEDLLTYLPEFEMVEKTTAQLHTLKENCMQENVWDRPVFWEILKTLKHLG